MTPFFLEDPFQTSKVSVGEIPMVSASILAMKKTVCLRYIELINGGDPNPLLTGYTLFGGSSHLNSEKNGPVWLFRVYVLYVGDEIPSYVGIVS